MKAISDVRLTCKTLAKFNCSWDGKSYYRENIKFVEVEGRNLDKVAPPDDAFSFTFVDQVIGTTKAGEEKVKIFSHPFDESPLYYYGGTVYGREEFIEKAKEEMLLNHLFEVNKRDWEKIIFTREGKCVQFNEGDILIGIEGEEPPPKRMSRVVLGDEILRKYVGGEIDFQHGGCQTKGEIETICLQDGTLRITCTEKMEKLVYTGSGSRWKKIDVIPFEQSLEVCEVRIKEDDQTIMLFLDMDFKQEYCGSVVRLTLPEGGET